MLVCIFLQFSFKTFFNKFLLISVIPECFFANTENTVLQIQRMCLQIRLGILALFITGSQSIIDIGHL